LYVVIATVFLQIEMKERKNLSSTSIVIHCHERYTFGYFKINKLDSFDQLINSSISQDVLISRAKNQQGRVDIMVCVEIFVEQQHTFFI
jgi:hypothetical protein